MNYSLHFGGHLQSSCLLNWVWPKNSLEQGTFWKFWKVTAIKTYKWSWKKSWNLKSSKEYVHVWALYNMTAFEPACKYDFLPLQWPLTTFWLIQENFPWELAWNEWTTTQSYHLSTQFSLKLRLLWFALTVHPIEMFNL